MVADLHEHYIICLFALCGIASSIDIFAFLVATLNGLSGNGIPYFGGASVGASGGFSGGMYSTGKSSLVDIS